MPVSQTAEYALRAVTCLAQHNTAQTTQSIAGCTNVPLSYLPKVLQPLTRADIVSAQRGVRGGYKLQRDPESLTVIEVVNCVDPVRRFDSCPSHGAGASKALCPLHKLLDEVQESMQRRFTETTIQDLAFGPDGKPLRCGQQEADETSANGTAVGAPHDVPDGVALNEAK
ncbi:HTH-type transcriptional regulator CymR [Posidoniimonas polymericola]|uniref:HTH-type transcriptional regulator CymR n=1 Tax=Posidoniimonas polymericola TaxID=2528002 RepID=A0A5C5XZC6_9BACT|nr:Rrf2 family transcriptional regulator [Posidoniimonas polymericola]TWT66842.1 HTH-type transcriptional regulator CymR [Posidoniimonas polymericola]